VQEAVEAARVESLASARAEAEAARAQLALRAAEARTAAAVKAVAAELFEAKTLLEKAARDRDHESGREAAVTTRAKEDEEAMEEVYK